MEGFSTYPEGMAVWLKDSINSVLSQTFADYSLIIVDDGSTDATEQILKRVHGRFFENDDKKLSVLFICLSQSFPYIIPYQTV